MGRRVESPGRGVSEAARSHVMQRDRGYWATQSTSHVASAAFSGDSWFTQGEVETEASDSQGGLFAASDLPDVREDGLRSELERANDESAVLDRLAAQVAAWRVETNQERAQLESENKSLRDEIKVLRLRAEVERTVQKKAALSEAVLPCAEAQNSLSKVLQAVQALLSLSEENCDTHSSWCEGYAVSPSFCLQAMHAII